MVSNYYFSTENALYMLTVQGEQNIKDYISQLKAKRKEILDAGLDMAISATIPDIGEILEDVEYDYNGQVGLYCGSWSVTDTYEGDYPLSLYLDEDFIKM